MVSNFVRTTIGELCREGGGNVQTGPFGSQLKASAYKPVGVPTIMPADLINYRVDDSRVARIGPEDHSRLARHQLQPGDIVYGRRGDIGRHALISAREQGWLCGTGCLRIRLGKSPADPQFVSYYLRQPKVIDYILGNAVGTTMPNLNTAILEAVPILLPPLDEQRAIAHILGSLDDKLELNRQMNQTLEEMARTVFKSWFVDFDPVHAKARGEQPVGMDAVTAALFPDSFEETELGPVPRGWSVAMLPDAIEVNPSRRLRKGTVAPYLDMANMPTSSARAVNIIGREFGSGMRFKNGDTLVARITPCLENGKTCLVDFLESDEVGWGSTEYIVLRPKAPLPTTFAYYLARTEHFRAYAIANMTGTSGRQRVPADSFRQYPVVVPSATVSEAFWQLTSQFHELMKANDEQSHTLGELRDTLLPKLMSGELRVPEVAEMMEA